MFLVLGVGYDSNWQWRRLMKIIHHIAVEHAGNASLFKPGCCCMNERVYDSNSHNTQMRKYYDANICLFLSLLFN